jgi:Sulfotransferase domain
MPLKVIGAGLARTGTMSLKLALEQLGFGPCHHMTELRSRPDLGKLWERAFDAALDDFEDIFESYHSTTDMPASVIWKELAEHYSNAKVILTVRDADSWLASAKATIFAPADASPETLDPKLQEQLRTIERMMHKMWRFELGALGFPLADDVMRLSSRTELITRLTAVMPSVFQRHNERVERICEPHRLLIYEVSKGWEPLCKFLNVPVPDTPLPRENSIEDFQKRSMQRPQ